MNIRSIVATAILTLSTAVPALANPTHLDLTVGSMQENTLVNGNTNVSSANARLSHQLSNRVSVYGDLTESFVNGSPVQMVSGHFRNCDPLSRQTFSALTGNLGLTYLLSSSTQVHVEAGNHLNDTLVLPNEPLSENYAGVSVSSRVF
jgi:hypothetical protein